MSADQLLIPIQHGDWLKSAPLRHLFDVLSEEGEESRVNGGAVRNSMLGEPIGDVDLSTTLKPQAVQAKLQKADIKTVTAGISHGTVTAIIDQQPFEITTLRRDLETDGRHAVVSFGRDWTADAMRRDLTMNALYCDRDGKIYDPLGGYDDLINRRVRFIGNADERIKEDYLRILRFFRFFARYGSGRPDAESLKACARLREGIKKLSAERVWQEFKKILSVDDPCRALLWMRTAGVLTLTVPETENWGIDFIGDRIAVETSLHWPLDVLGRLQVMVPPNKTKMKELAARLRLSGSESGRMAAWAQAQTPDLDISSVELEKQLYQGSQAGITDRIRFEIVRHHHNTQDQQTENRLSHRRVSQLDLVVNWRRPEFPVKGRDLRDAGILCGPDMGKILQRLEQQWVESGFSLSKDALLAAI